MRRRSIDRSLVAASAVAAFTACASGAPGPTPMPAPSAASPSAHAPCETLTTCEVCAEVPSCHFCTEPRGCVGAGATCAGLSLAGAPACTNDPLIGGSQRARAIATMHAGLLAELRDMSAAGPAIDARLENLTSVSFPIPAQHCYSLVWSVAEDAVLADATVGLDFIGPKGSQGALITPLAVAGWSHRSCTSVPGSLVVTLLDSETFNRLVSGGKGKISFVLHSRPRTASDSDEGAGPPVSALGSGPRSSPRGPSNQGSPPRGSVGIDCQDCTFPCESAKRDCERRCFVDEREMPGRQVCERTCAQIGRACLSGCPGCR